MAKGCFVFRELEEAYVGKPLMVTVAMDSAGNCKAAVKALEPASTVTRPRVTERHIAVSNRVSARLIADDPDHLAIKPISEEVQSLELNRLPIWSWRVTPQGYSCGKSDQTMRLKTANIVNIPGNAKLQQMQNDPIPKTVTVRVTWMDCGHKLQQDAASWKGIVAGIVTALVAILASMRSLRDAVLGLFRKGGAKNNIPATPPSAPPGSR